MYALKKLIQNATDIDDGKIFILTFADPNLKSLVLSLNKDQLKMGELADDSFIQEYSDTSVNFYGKRPGRFTLYETGEFYNSFTVLDVTKEAIIEFADTEKPDKNLLEYGEVIGLNGQSLEILINEAIPIMRDKILSELLRGI
jgi:hypothetical protein